MDYSAWTVDLKRKSATHSSGFKLAVEGNPRDPSAVHPGKFPSGVGTLEKVRLLRTGMEALAMAASAPPIASARAAGASTRPTLSLKSKPSPKSKLSSNNGPRAGREDTDPVD